MKRIVTAGAIIFFSISDCLSQNGEVGSGFGTNDWSTTGNFSGSAGTSRIYTTTANGTGNQYFRLVTNWSSNWNQWGPSSTSSDYQVTPGTAVPSSEVVQNSTSKAYYINVSSTSHNYVFKTREGGNPPPSIGLIVFCVQGTVASISSTSRDLTNVYLNQSPTITANLSTSFATGQGAYLRYTTNGWASSSVVAMSGSGTTYTASIPAQPAGTTVIYYLFTSGNGLSISASDADFYTINLINNSGSNYSYTVNNSVITTGSGSGNWSSASTWSGGTKPTSGQAVIIDRSVTLDENATLGSLTINSGATFTASDATARTLTISNGGTLTNNGTFYAASGNLLFAGTGTIAGTSATTLNNVTIADGVNFGSTSTVSGTLQLNVGGYINTNPPTYASGSILKYNTGTVYSRYLEWSNTSGAGYPHHVQISNGGALDLGNGGTGTARSIGGNLTIDAGCGFYMDYLTNDMSQPLTVNGNLTNNGTLSLSESAGGGLKIGGNFTNNGTFNPYARTTEFLGSAAQTILGTLNSTGSTNNFYYLTISNTSGDVTLLSPVFVSNTLNLNTGRIVLGSNDLVLGSGVSIIGTPSETNRIKTNGSGVMTINNLSTARTFPVGNSTYNPVTISNGSNHNWSVRVEDAINNLQVGFNTNKAVLRTWHISPSVNPPSTGANITFQYDESATSSLGSSFNNAEDMHVWHYGTNWRLASSDITPTGTAGGIRTVTVNGLTQFSPYAIANKTGPLPVTFTSLTGNIRNARANLSWTIADEQNVDHYEVEESINGRQFQALTQVVAASRNHYQATDAQLFSGANYYRVKAVDIDGKLTFSKIIRLDNNALDQQIRVYPNPTRGELTLSLNISAGHYQIRLVNAIGQVVHQQSLLHDGGSRSLPLELPKLNAGVYQVEVRGGGQKYVRSVRIE